MGFRSAAKNSGASKDMASEPWALRKNATDFNANTAQADVR